MQSLNSIERFLFQGDVYLFIEKYQDENSRNPIQNQNQNIPNQINQTKLDNDQE